MYDRFKYADMLFFLLVFIITSYFLGTNTKVVFTFCLAYALGYSYGVRNDNI